MRITSGVTDKCVCATCKQEKHIGEFGKDKTISRGFRYSCKECTNTKRRGRYKEDNRRYHLVSKYGISPERYAEMHNDQGGLCAICRESAKLYIDHDHVSGEVRGLLCHKCNVAIGLLFDDPTRLERAAKYIRGMPCVLKVA